MKSPDPNIEAQLEQLLSAFCDDRLDDSGREQIEAILQDHPEARAYYLRYLDLHLELRRTGDIQHTQRDESIVSLPIRPTTRRRWVVSSAAVAAILIVGLAVALWQTMHPASSPPVTAVAPAESPSPIAYVTRAENVTWRGPASLPKIGDQVPAGRIELLQGQLRLDFFDGVAVTVGAPAEISIQSSDSILLTQGQIAVRATSADGGITVNTPSAVFVDVGTEFAVNVVDDVSSQLYVREGEVVASVLGKGGTVSQGISDSAVSGESLIVDSSQDGIQRANLSESQFIAMIEPGLIPLHLGVAYVNAVVESAPVGYWRFEEIEDGFIRNEMASGHRAAVSGAVGLEGSENRACFFTPEEEDQSILVNDGFEGINGDSEYTIELWMNPLNHDWSAVAGLVRVDSDGRGKHLKGPLPEARLLQLECMPAKDSKRCFLSRLFPEAKDNSVRLFHRQRPEFKDTTNAFSQQPYEPGKWHHIVAVRNAEQIALFHNGVLVDTAVTPANQDSDTYRLILGRYSRIVKGKHRWMPNPFAGRIDEVALYDRALTEDEVASHYQSVRR
jgi:ferric-dicitrate binding protein FerR (iron transport regulator)